MTIEQAIEQYDGYANVCMRHNLTVSQKEFEQLAAWLRELQETRKERDYWQEKANSYEQTIFKLTDSISKQPEIIRCKGCKNLIDRQATLNALMDAVKSVGVLDADDIKTVFDALPSVQHEKEQLSPEGTTSDLISRQQAIDGGSGT
jgi:hypothetical protein